MQRKPVVDRPAWTVFAVIAAVVMAGCGGTVPDIAPVAAGVVSQDAESWFIMHSQGTPEHPNSTSNGGWVVTLPTIGHIGYVLTPYRTAVRPQTIMVQYRVIASSDAIPVSYQQDASPCREHNPCTPVAEFHVFFEQRGDDFSSETGRWWYKPGFRITDTIDASYTAQPFVADGQVHTLTVPLARSEWTSVTDHSSTEDFEAALMNAGYVGITFGGSDFFAQGVFVRQGTVRFEMIEFRVQ